MSRYYAMRVRIKDFNAHRTTDIRQAASAEWPFVDENWEHVDNHLTCEAEDYISAGESEDECADRLSMAIWQANQAYCPVEVDATFLDAVPPYEEHHRSEEDYMRLLQPSTDQGETS